MLRSTAQACAFFHDRDIVFGDQAAPAKNDQEPCFVMEVKRVPDGENPYPTGRANVSPEFRAIRPVSSPLVRIR